MEIGYRFGRRRRSGNPERSRAAAATLEGAVFGLMALLIAFTFDGAGTRFEAREALSFAKPTGSARHTCDWIPPETRPKLQECCRTYLKSRLAVGKKIPDVKAARAELARSEALQL